MNLLELIRNFSFRTGINPPDIVTSALDHQTQQVLSLLNEVLEDLMDHNWSGATQESVWTSVAGEDQGALTAIAPNGFKWILQETLYNRTERLPLYGPVSAPEWQALKALPNSGPHYKYRIQRGRFLVNPEMPAGLELAFEYASNWAVEGVDGTSRPYPTQDTDIFLIPDTVLLAGLRWKWKYEKGLEYAEDFSRYELLRANALGRDGTKSVLHMDGQGYRAVPGVIVPSGSWDMS